MKITKEEKIWFISAAVFFLLYNLPCVPPYGNAAATILHAALTVIPLWICIYVGFVKICRIYRLKDEDKNKEKGERNDD